MKYYYLCTNRYSRGDLVTQQLVLRVPLPTEHERLHQNHPEIDVLPRFVIDLFSNNVYYVVM